MQLPQVRAVALQLNKTPATMLDTFHGAQTIGVAYYSFLFSTEIYQRQKSKQTACTF